MKSFAATATENAKSARGWRNQRISHSDLNLAIDPDAKSLDPTTLASIQSVLDAVHAALDAISSAFLEQFLLLVLAGWVNRQQQDVIDYQQEENRVLRAGLRGKRLSLSDDDRRRLA